jgi:hypothetical protein
LLRGCFSAGGLLLLHALLLFVAAHAQTASTDVVLQTVLGRTVAHPRSNGQARHAYVVGHRLDGTGARFCQLQLLTKQEGNLYCRQGQSPEFQVLESELLLTHFTPVAPGNTHFFHIWPTSLGTVGLSFRTASHSKNLDALFQSRTPRSTNPPHVLTTPSFQPSPAVAAPTPHPINAPIKKRPADLMVRSQSSYVPRDINLSLKEGQLPLLQFGGKWYLNIPCLTGIALKNPWNRTEGGHLYMGTYIQTIDTLARPPSLSGDPAPRESNQVLEVRAVG